MRSIYKMGLIMAVAAGLFWSCDDDTSNPIPPTGNMVMNLSDLEALPDGWRYEAWLTIGSDLFSAAKFQVDAGTGGVQNMTLPVESSKLESADGFIVTVESTTDGDPAPSDVRVLSGTFDQYEAVLTHDGAQAIGADLTDMTGYSGNYLIAAPTSATTDDDTSGVWFIDNSGIAPAAGLNLPSLNTGWVYEGWTIINGTPVSTGRFADPDGPDDACTYCGPMAAPPFPGEDFLTNAPAGLSFPTNLAERVLVISVEPEPDYSPAPYQIKILAADVPDAGTLQLMTTYPMDAIAAVVPSGSVLRYYGFDCTNDGCE